MQTDTRDRRPYAAELKFLVPPATADAIRSWAREHLIADPHGGGLDGDQYTTTSLYSDTPGQDVYRRTGSYGRSKYRVRRYGSSDVVFLERKLRTRALLSKRRSIVVGTDLPRLNDPLDNLTGWPGAWFAARLAMRRLGPVCQVTYDRTARVANTPYGLARLTVDSNLAARVASQWAFEAPDYIPVLTNEAIVELKFIVAMPAVFKRVIETFGLVPATVSKYRLSAGALGMVPAAHEVGA
jgi:hypothetical protein